MAHWQLTLSLKTDTVGDVMRGRRSRSRGVPLDGALAVVTGAGSGIGRATALALCQRGARVVALDVDGAAAKATATETGGAWHEVDVADGAAMAELSVVVESEQGPVDVLVNNAGVGMSARFCDMEDGDWEWILGVNLVGVVNGCRAFGTRMVDRGRGHVVNISSGLAFFPRATEPAYCTTKAAVLTLSRALRADWRRAGVGVSVVCPGVVDTPIVNRTRYRGERARPETVARVQRAFARRGHPPAQVAAAVLSAVTADRAVVPVGIEAWIGWLARGLVPVRLGDRLSGLSVGGL
jgi:NAD(P)-dependent dehydrogenase (short-subunit alcohol dehydrogenase family)